MFTAIPSAVPNVPQAVTEAQPAAAVTRVGVVSGLGVDYLQVRLGGADTATQAGWVASYEPMLGDVVAVSGQDPYWVVLGTFGGRMADNTAVPNYSFEEGAVGALPPSWQLVTTSGTPTLVTTAWTRANRIDGDQVAALSSAAAGAVSTEVVSGPIPVNAGNVWVVGGHLATLGNFSATTTCLTEAAAAWYGDNTLGSLISTNLSGTYAVTRGMPWRQIRCQGTAGFEPPPGASRLRLRFAFTWTAAAGDTIYLDRMIARRIL